MTRFQRTFKKHLRMAELELPLPLGPIYLLFAGMANGLEIKGKHLLSCSGN
jgi:hypothetical protein